MNNIKMQAFHLEGLLGPTLLIIDTYIGAFLGVTVASLYFAKACYAWGIYDSFLSMLILSPILMLGGIVGIVLGCLLSVLFLSIVDLIKGEG